MGSSPGNECGWAPDRGGAGSTPKIPPRLRVRAGYGKKKPARARPVRNTRPASTRAKGDFKGPVARRIIVEGAIGLRDYSSTKCILRLKVC